MDKKTKRINVTTSVDDQIWEKGKRNKIAWSEALEFGINFLYADKDGFDYPFCKLRDKMHKIIQHRNSLLQEVSALREQIKLQVTEKDEDLDKEIDDVFNFEEDKNGK